MLVKKKEKKNKSLPKNHTKCFGCYISLFFRVWQMKKYPASGTSFDNYLLNSSNHLPRLIMIRRTKKICDEYNIFFHFLASKESFLNKMLFHLLRIYLNPLFICVF